MKVVLTERRRSATGKSGYEYRYNIGDVPDNKMHCEADAEGWEFFRWECERDDSATTERPA